MAYRHLSIIKNYGKKMTGSLRKIQLTDKIKWKKLYRGYADFYKVEMNEKILQTL